MANRRSVNKVILIGNLGGDPELRHTAAGNPVATFTLATTETWTGKDGQPEERTEWHRIVAWGRLAEICKEYLTKGRQVFVEGRIQTRTWEDQNGQKRSTTEIVANQMVMLGGRPEGAGGARTEAEPAQAPPVAYEDFSRTAETDDLPF